MSERGNHKFQFDANQISAAAKSEATYHRERIAHWEGRYEKAKATVEATVSAKVWETPVTGGVRQLSVGVDYGDAEAWAEATLAHRKIQEHRTAAERYETDARVYGTQGHRPYDLDIDDVHHFRLGGQPREE